MSFYPAIGVYGYPKSGNTWIQGVFQSLGREIDPEYTQEDIHITRRNKKRFNIHPKVRIEGEEGIIFKSHEKFVEGGNFFADAKRFGVSNLKKVILVKRNPFDMTLSYLNYAVWALKKRKDIGAPMPARIDKYIRESVGLSEAELEEAQKQADTLSFLKEVGACEKAILRFVENNFGIESVPPMYGTWLEHTTSWENQIDYPIHSIRYEDLVFNLPAQIKALAYYLDAPVEMIETGFEQRQEDTVIAKKNDEKEQKASFYNKCTAGYFWDYLPKDLVEDIFIKHAIVFAQTGYHDLLETCPTQDNP